MSEEICENDSDTDGYRLEENIKSELKQLHIISEERCETDTNEESFESEYDENFKSELFSWENSSLPYSSTYLDLFLPDLNLRKQPELINQCLDLRAFLVKDIDRSVIRDNQEISWKTNYSP